MKKNLMQRIDYFLQVTVLEQIPATVKVEKAKVLLKEATTLYPKIEGNYKEVLGRRIDSLENAIKRYSMAVVLPPKYKSEREMVLVKSRKWLRDYRTPSGDALATTRTYLEKLRTLAVPPTNIETDTMNALTQLFNDIRNNLDYATMTSRVARVEVKKPTPPSALTKANNFWKEMENRPLTNEFELKRACYTARGVSGELKVAYKDLSYNELQIWNTTFANVFSSVNNLHGRWQAQLAYIANQERKTRRYAFQGVKQKYEMDKYANAIRKVEREGDIELVAETMANSFLQESGEMVSMVDNLLEKARSGNNPNILNVPKVTAALDNAIRVGNGILGRIRNDLIRRDIVKSVNLLIYKRKQITDLKYVLTNETPGE